MYWPGYYAPPGGLPHVQQPPLLRPLPGLAMPPMQQMSQFQGMNASLSSGISSYPDVHPLFPPVSSNPSLNSASLASTVAPIQLPSTTALSQAMPFSLEMSQVSVANRVPSASLPAVTPSVSLSTVPHFAPAMETLTSLPQNMHKGPPTSLPAVAPTGSLPPVPHLSPGMEILTSLPQTIPSVASGKPKVGPVTPVPSQNESQSTPILGSSSSNQADTPFSLVTPGLLMQPTHSLEKTSIDIDIKSSENKSKPLLPGPPAPEQEAKTKPAAAAKEPILPLPRQSYHKPNGAISGTHEYNRGRGRGRGRGTGYPRPQQASKPLLPGPPAPEQEAKTKPATAAKEPILPLPRQSYHKPNGAISGTHEYNRGRGRGRGRGTGYPRPQQARFTEDFDFMAMNEKFNKDEVWGHLGKSRSPSNIRDEDDEADAFEEDNSQPPNLDVKPVYVKDDFFDTLSCNTNDQTSNGRIKFSEQLKIDTETFGNFSRHRALYGGGRGHRGGRAGFLSGQGIWILR
ncbi:hypothetical protein HPP92_024405 [Vanilla planifolia]|uniref:Protein decapping 5 n=1 Tax=Vanilla planifolia TaxID=51239 RepID=A0A835PS56_VANPL|nr:hypothetical protein HPP92_024405 [Vanilla planifolia]